MSCKLTSSSQLSHPSSAPLPAVYQAHEALVVPPQALILSLHGGHLSGQLLAAVCQGLLAQLVCGLHPTPEGAAQQPATMLRLLW